MALSIARLINRKAVALAAPVALALVVSACSEDDNTGNPTGMDGGGTGGAQGGTGGAKATGGAKGSGGSKSSGGASSGGQGGASGSGSGGTAGAAGAAGAGGAGTGGAGNDGGGTDGGGGDSSTQGAGGTGGTPGTGGTDGGSCTAQLPLTKPTVGSTIQVPSGATVVQHFHAEGTQNYTCTATTQGDGAVTYAWSAAVPEAKLFDGCGVEQATHFAGPTWKSDADGSSVVGTKKAAETHSGTIPWLLLTAKSHDGTGIFSQVTFIQRVDTTGGVAPTAPCGVETDGASNVNQVVKVPYTADYYFFEGAADAGP